MSRTFGTPTDNKKFTLSLWVKRGNLANIQNIISAGSDGNNFFEMYFYANGNGIGIDNYTLGAYQLRSNTTGPQYRDPSGYYHIVLSVDTTQSAGANAVKLYVNNSQQILNFANYTQNTNLFLNKAATLSYLGKALFSGTYFDGYFSDTYFVDGQTLDPSAFAQADPTTNQWLPKQYTGTYGTNGFHLDFSSGAITASLGLDSAPIDTSHVTVNNWTLTNMSTGSQVIDTPTNNFATLNPLLLTSTTLSQGNLKATKTAITDVSVLGSIAVQQ